MDLFPHARRALLTAYADTDAAIQAINVVDVDHYLLKPWDPPEEKLYPVVDALIDDLAGDRRPGGPGRQGGRAPLVGPVVRDPRLPGPQPGAVPLVRGRRAGGPPAARRGRRTGRRRSRWWSPRTGTTLAAPTLAEVAGAVGLSTAPVRDFYDLIIVGGGPAGLGAAVYGASEGLKTVMVERQATGGQAGQSSRIENYLGFPDGVSGRPADRPGPPAGGQVRRRGVHHPGRGRPGRTRSGPHRPVRRRQRTVRARGDPGDRGGVPAAGRARRGDLTGRGRLLRLGGDRGRRPARVPTCTSWAAPTRPVRRRCSSPGTRAA